jgi:hypothetical protein
LALGEPPFGMSAPDLHARNVEVPAGAEFSHGLSRVGDPVFLSDWSADLEMAIHELKEWMTERADGQGRPQITRVSRGAEVSDRERDRARLPKRIAETRTWSVWSAADQPTTADGMLRRSESAAMAIGDGCTGQNGFIQADVAFAGQFGGLVRSVRGHLATDLITPFCADPPQHRPRPVVYAFACTRGIHRSVAVCELLAHCMQTSGISSVEVIHEDLDLNVYDGRGHPNSYGSCGCPGMCRTWRIQDEADKSRQRHAFASLDEARKRARAMWRASGRAP